MSGRSVGTTWFATRVGPLAVAALLVAGCASTTATPEQSYQGSRLARPDRIVVYDFAASAADMPPGMAPAVAAPPAQQTGDDVSLGRKLGAEIARNLVAEIQGMGLPAAPAAGQPPLRVNDIAIAGYFVSVDSGSAVKRFALGFGAGAAELQTVAEVYVMTAQGLRRLGATEISSTGPKGPGEALPLAMAVASGNPIGLIVSSAVKVGGEVSGMSTVEGSAKRTAKELGEQLKVGAQRQGWIY